MFTRGGKDADEDVTHDVEARMGDLEGPAEAEIKSIDYPKAIKSGAIGWIIARFSGTEPLLRIFCEMPTREQAEQACDEFREFLGL